MPDIGTVARVTGTEEAQLTADIRVRMLTMHTIIPLPGRQGDYLIVTCASPNLPLAKQALRPVRRDHVDLPLRGGTPWQGRDRGGGRAGHPRRNPVVAAPCRV